MCRIHPIGNRDRHRCICFRSNTLRLMVLLGLVCHVNLWLHVTWIVYSHREAILSSIVVIFTTDPCRGLPDSSLRKIRPTRVKRFLLLIENVRVHAELLQMFLSLLVRFLPIWHTEGALAPDQPPEHLLVLLGDPLHVFFLGPCVEALKFMWSYKWKLEA